MLPDGAARRKMLHTRVSHTRRDKGRRRAVGLAETERLARFRIVPALAYGEALDVLGEQAIGRIVAGNLRRCRRLVRVAGDMPVGNPHRRPDRRPCRPGPFRRSPESRPLGCRRWKSTRPRSHSRIRSTSWVITWMASRAVRARCNAERHQVGISDQPLGIHQLLAGRRRWFRTWRVDTRSSGPALCRCAALAGSCLAALSLPARAGRHRSSRPACGPWRARCQAWRSAAASQ